MKHVQRFHTRSADAQLGFFMLEFFGGLLFWCSAMHFCAFLSPHSPYVQPISPAAHKLSPSSTPPIDRWVAPCLLTVTMTCGTSTALLHEQRWKCPLDRSLGSTAWRVVASSSGHKDWTRAVYFAPAGDLTLSMGH